MFDNNKIDMLVTFFEQVHVVCTVTSEIYSLS
jgi:hypothetical protein